MVEEEKYTEASTHSYALKLHDRIMPIAHCWKEKNIKFSKKQNYSFSKEIPRELHHILKSLNKMSYSRPGTSS